MTPVNKSTVQFVIDTKASLFTVQAFADGIVAVVAHSPKFAMRDVTGAIEFDPGAFENSPVRTEIKLASLDIMDEATMAERREIQRVMFDEVLEKNLHPVATLRSSRVSANKVADNVFRADVFGEPTLHGLTRRRGIDSQVSVGEDTLRAQGSFSLLQSDSALTIALSQETHSN